ncbi:MAG: exosortase K [Clostridiales bacterium]|nr:exosortase K [Clostridiales bacterium]
MAVSQYWAVYLAGFIIAFGIKLFYSKAACGDLEWILAPTVWWIKAISGVAFEKAADVGYVNHHFRFIIAPACSGVQFLIISFLTIVYSFVHRMGTIKRGFCWLAIGFVASYLFTIFVNGFRLIVSFHLLSFDTGSLWITAGRLHAMAGTAIFFVSLLVLYQIAGYVSLKSTRVEKQLPSNETIHHAGKPLWQTAGRFLPPAFWYFAITLGIPLLNRASVNNSENFWRYAAFQTGVCLAIFALLCLGSLLRKRCARQNKIGT